LEGHLGELLRRRRLSRSDQRDAVLEEVSEWQNRPLEALYPLIFFDAIRIKEGTLKNKAVYVALGVRPDGTQEILGSSRARAWHERTQASRTF
jgi:putative transposase